MGKREGGVMVRDQRQGLPPPEINPILPRVVTISELGSIERGSCNPFYESWVDFRSVPSYHYTFPESIFHRCLVGYFLGSCFMVIIDISICRHFGRVFYERFVGYFQG